MSYADSPKDYWLISKKWPKRVFWSLIAAAIALFFITPMYCDYSERARAYELFITAQGAKEKVERALIGNPGSKVELKARELISDALGVMTKDGEKIEIPFREITEQGEIRLFSPQLGVMLVLSPNVKDKKVTWSCWGRPLKKVPAACRGES
jgi:hypothetical protein